MLEADMGNCRPLTRSLADRPAAVRIGAPLARLLAPVL